MAENESIYTGRDAGRRHPWSNHSATYRAQEIAQLAQWILTGASGSVIGLSGSGKSDMMGFLCHRHEVLYSYLPAATQTVTLLQMDLNNLPAGTLSALFRVILRTFYEQRAHFVEEMQPRITQLYLENRAAHDPFLAQSALRELLLELQQREHRVVFVLDRFDHFSQLLSPEIGDALRGLRDSFKDTLSYIAGMSVGLAYVPEQDLFGDLHRLLDQHACYVGPMNRQDTEDTITRRVQPVAEKPTPAEREMFWQLTGGYPSLVLVACRWWLTQPTHPELAAWRATLYGTESVRQRLADIWRGLTQEEQLVLAAVQKSQLLDSRARAEINRRHQSMLTRLTERGLCQGTDDGYRLFSQLFADYVAEVGGHTRGRIWLDGPSQTLYHGEMRLDALTPRESTLLQFFLREPRIQHSYTDIIVAAWSEEERYNGVSNEALYQAIRGLRQKIEPHSSQPVYVVNWRGRPEGGYIFYPEGRPR